METALFDDSIKQTEVDILLQQLKQLSRNDRVLLGLYFYEKLTVEDIASVLSIEQKKVKTALNRIIPYLKKKPFSVKSRNKSYLEISG